MQKTDIEKLTCYHCGEDCKNEKIALEEKFFCCEGCKMVFQIINQNDLCDYYEYNKNPGITQRIKVRENKFAFLDDEKIQQQLISFRDKETTHIVFYLPQMHCSSCLYLIEHLRKFDKGIISSTVNFTRKEATIIIDNNHSSIRKAAEMLTRIGYEPYISLNDLKEKRPALSRSLIYQVGIAGFCFGNIMLMSFPEYFGVDSSELWMKNVFRWGNFILALPVFLYSAMPFYSSSIKSIKHGYLNIDLPIAIAIILIFVRSTLDIISGNGSGYFDSLTGIIFLMLVGRILQDKTYRHLSFERDYNSYFPIAVSVLKEGKEIPTMLHDIKVNDTILIHHEELIPVDGLLSKGKALIDYSFVTGESLPVLKETGEMIYAGGKQTEANIEMVVMKEVTQGYLTQLWNREELKTQDDNTAEKKSFVQIIAKYFTYIVLAITIVTAIFWWLEDPSKIWIAVTSICLVACPCGLVLTHTFTNGNILSILGRQKFYLRNNQTIELLATADAIVFDKTGTITSPNEMNVNYEGKELNEKQLRQIYSLALCSNHPLSKQLAKYIDTTETKVKNFSETIGEGITGVVDEQTIYLGNAKFVGANESENSSTQVYAKIDGEIVGKFLFQNRYRKDVFGLMRKLQKHYSLSLISGDSNAEEKYLREQLGDKTNLLFQQSPIDKLNFIHKLRGENKKVIMIGDGLNDAGALKISDVGIAVAEQTNNFTPASSAIIEAKQLTILPNLIAVCKAHRKIILASFAISIIYNIVGLSFAVQGLLSPLVAAVLMPISSITILLLTFGSSTAYAKWLGLR